MKDSEKKSALLIAGPTASGKSALAIRQAQARNGVIINADSMQVYQQLRIITARPSEAEMTSAQHKLYGYVSGASAYSVAQWLQDAEQAIHAAWAQDQLPIIVGGTGLYFMALTRGLTQLPPIPGELRQKWRSFKGDLHTALRERDPETAARLQPADHQRILRALEVVDATGQGLSHWHLNSQSNALLNNINVEKWFLDVPREVLYARAEQRFERMLVEGALEEVQSLPKLSPELPMMRAIGVPELQQHLHGDASLDEAVANAKTATRHYIKRQLTWWRGQMKDWKAVTVRADI